MANLKSSKKDIRRTAKRKERNSQQKATIRTVAKSLLKTIKLGKKEEAISLYKDFSSLVDRAAKKNLIHKKKADRSKSRVAIKIAAIGKTV
jgi:small subunit ribosomal protein S20